MGTHPRVPVVPILGLLLVLASCGEFPRYPNEPSTGSTTPPQPPVPEAGDGRLVASVAWQGVGLPDRAVEVLGQGLIGATDGAGVVEFTLPAGTYTVRAHVNRGGLALATQDVVVTIHAGKTTRVDFTDCVDCVSAG